MPAGTGVAATVVPGTPIRRKLSDRPKSRRQWRSKMEFLEDRLMLTGLDLTTSGATGAINNALFYQFTKSGSGTGAFNSFVRIQSNRSVEQGYNTDYRPPQFDENASNSYTRAIKLGTIPTVVAPGGLRYYEFILDVNQSSSTPSNLISLDELRLYVTNSLTKDPNLLHGYSASNSTLTDSASNRYSPVYDLNAGTGGNYIKLDANLSSGSGSGDMVALIPTTVLGTDLNQYVYLYSKFGVKYPNTSGFEEWDAGAALPVGSISGQVFEDVNGNGTQDTGDGGLGGRTV